MGRIVDSSCADYVAELASSKPAPGGGGTSALVGAIGVALGSMVGALTVGKPKYAEVEPEMLELLTRAQGLTEELLELVDLDAKVFLPLSHAYGLPADTEEQRAHKNEVLEECLHNACAVPLEIMRACCRAIEMLERFARIGSRLAISDAGSGAACCRAALQASSLNVYANTKLMKDRVHADACDIIARDLLDEYLPRVDEVFAYVEGQLA